MQDDSSHSDSVPPPADPDRRGSRSGANFRLVVGIVLAGLIVVFTLQNADVVELRFLFWTWSMPRAVMIFGVLAAGILLGWILSSWLHHKRKVRGEG
jgi:putative membrane protein